MMMEDCDSSTPKLELYRCTKCRRSFFSDESRISHYEAKHEKSLNIKLMTTKVSNQKKHAPMKILRKRSSMTKSESISSTFLSNWPPERASSKLQSRHRMNKNKVHLLFKRWLSDNYSPIIHDSQDVKKVLTQEYAKDSMLPQERVNDLSFLTGLSTRFIKLWFHLRKLRGQLSLGDELLYKSFLHQPYPDDESLQMLMMETGLLLSQIRLWFRLSRAKYRVMEFKEVEEKVLWAWFLKSADTALEDKKIEEVSKMVGMNVEDVKTVFKYWNDAWFVADVPSKEKLLTNSQEICDLLGIDITKHENVLNALEKARNNQKMFGIPICCKVVDTGKPGHVSANFPFLKTYFDSYLEDEDRLLDTNEQSDDEQLEPFDQINSEKLDCFAVEEDSPATSILDQHAGNSRLLKVQNDVLRQSDPGSPTMETENEGQNLYTLFNTPPTETNLKEADPGPAFSEHFPSNAYDSADSPERYQVEESTCDSGNESDNTESDDTDDSSDAEFIKEVLIDRPYTFIDLTLDSDHDTSDQEDINILESCADAAPILEPPLICINESQVFPVDIQENNNDDFSSGITESESASGDMQGDTGNCDVGSFLQTEPIPLDVKSKVMPGDTNDSCDGCPSSSDLEPFDIKEGVSGNIYEYDEMNDIHRDAFSDGCPSPRTLVICESDEEMLPDVTFPASESTAIKDESVHECEVSTSNPSAAISSVVDATSQPMSSDLPSKDPILPSKNDLLMLVGVKTSSDQDRTISAESNNAIMPPTSLQHKMKHNSQTTGHSGARVENFSKKLHCNRKAIYIEPISLTRRMKSNRLQQRPHLGRMKRNSDKKGLRIGKSLFSKSLAECKLSSYTEMKRSLKRRNSFSN